MCLCAVEQPHPSTNISSYSHSVQFFLFSFTILCFHFSYLLYLILSILFTVLASFCVSFILFCFMFCNCTLFFSSVSFSLNLRLSTDRDLEHAGNSG